MFQRMMVSLRCLFEVIPQILRSFNFQAFAISYHQCRWNYNDEEDCRNVDKGFDDHDIPFDVLWLDIEHTVKRYFTWDAQKFPDSVKLLDDLNAKGRKVRGWITF